MAITTRIVSHKMGEKAHAYLNRAGGKSWILDGEVVSHQKGIYSQTLTVDDGLIQAFVEVRGTKVSIHMVCKMKVNPITGRFAPSDYGTGKSGKLLAEKFLNRFFDHLDKVNIDNIKERHFTLTADLVKQVEAEIDQNIDPKQITEADIDAYDRIEMIYPVEEALRYFCKRMGEEYLVSYDADAQVFNLEFCTSDFSIAISLGDIVRKKWAMDECLGKASVACVGDLYAEADERKKREAHYIKHLLELAMPNLRKIVGGDKRKLEGLKEHFLYILDNQIIVYDEGRKHSNAGQLKWNRDEFIDHCGFGADRYVTPFIDMLYSAYCNGFAKTNGDTLLSGEGAIQLPFLS